MIQRTTAVSSDVGAPFELISANPPPMTRAAKARMPKISDAFRGVLQKKRDCERSGGPDPLVAGPGLPATSGPSHRQRLGIATHREHLGEGGLEVFAVEDVRTGAAQRVVELVGDGVEARSLRP